MCPKLEKNKALKLDITKLNVKTIETNDAFKMLLYLKNLTSFVLVFCVIFYEIYKKFSELRLLCFPFWSVLYLFRVYVSFKLVLQH